MSLDVSEIFADAATEAAKTVLQEGLKAELSQRGFSALYVAVAVEISRSVVGQIMGPLLGIFLKLIDPTQKKLDLLIAEPLDTGIRSARLALSIQPVNEMDKRLVEEYCLASMQSLERAYTHAARLAKLDQCTKIRLTQAAFARQMGATASVKAFLDEFSRTLNARARECASANERLQKEETSLMANMNAKEVEIVVSLIRQFLDGHAVRLRLRDPIPSSATTSFFVDLDKPDDARLAKIMRSGWNSKIQNMGFIVLMVNLKLSRKALQVKLEEIQAFRKFWEI